MIKPLPEEQELFKRNADKMRLFQESERARIELERGHRWHTLRLRLLTILCWLSIPFFLWTTYYVIKHRMDAPPPTCEETCRSQICGDGCITECLYWSCNYRFYHPQTKACMPYGQRGELP